MKNLIKPLFLIACFLLGFSTSGESQAANFNILDINECGVQSTVLVPVILDDPITLTSYEFTFQWDGTGLQYTNVINKVGGIFVPFNLADTTSVNWNSPAGSSISFNPGDTLFCIEFSFIGSLNTTYAIDEYIGNNPVFITPPKAFDNPFNPSFPVSISSGSVTFRDAQPGFDSCPTDITENTPANSCDAAATWTIPTATDCDGNPATVTEQNGIAPGDVFPLGTTTVTYTAIDLLGNTATCQFTVTVNDNVPPTLTDCPASETITLAPGQTTVTLNDPKYTPTTSDNCPNPALSFVINNGGTMTSGTGDINGQTLQIGANVVTYTLTDGTNSVDCMFTITVEAAPPSTGAVLTVCDATADCCLNPTTIDVPVKINTTETVRSFDMALYWNGAGLAFNSLSSSTIDVINEVTQSMSGDTIILSWSATDPAGRSFLPNEELFTFTFDILVCDPDSTYDVNFYDGPSRFIQNPPLLFRPNNAGLIMPVNTVNGAVSFTGGSGTTTITCPPDADVECASDIIPNNNLPVVNSSCNDTYTVTNSGVSLASGNADCIGATYEVTYTATNDADPNDTYSCTQTFTIARSTTPIVCPADQTGTLDMNCEFTVPDYTSLATINNTCNQSPVVVTQSPAAGTTISRDTTVKLFVTLGTCDADSCSFNLDLSDMTPPTVDCMPNDTVYLDANCMGTIADYSSTTATDACDGTLTVTQSPAAGTAVTANTTVVLSATDNAGNTGTCSIAVAVLDTISPTITCPSDMDVQADANCNFTLTDFTSQATATDNCANPVTITQSPAAGTTISDTTVITLTATDDNSNTATCTFTLNLIDNIPPQITTCPADRDIVLDANCEATLPDYTNLVVATDNCSSSTDLTVTQSPAAGTTISGHNTTQLITFTVTDENNQSTTCTMTVTAKDQTPPSITCPIDMTVNLDANCEFTLPTYTATTDDNCSPGNITVSQSPVAGTVITADQIVTLTATDAAGQSSTCTFNLTTDGSLDITCPADQNVTADANCQFTLIDYTGLANVTVCTTLDRIEQSPVAGTIVTGRTTITLTAFQTGGGMASCTFDVIPADNTPPMVTDCPGNQIIPVDQFVCSAQLADYTGQVTVTDNCGGSSVTVTQRPVAATTITTVTTVTIFADDGNGNIDSSCVFTVTPEDQTPPTITCPADATVSLSSNCQAILADYTSSATLFDNCTSVGNLIVDQTPLPGSIINGSTTVTLIVFDEAGLQSSCDFMVIATDFPPTITCPADQDVFVDSSCEAVLPSYLTQTTVSDDCSTNLVVTQSPVAGTTITSTTIITMMVTDDAGNTATCDFTVSPLDTIPPTVLCPADQDVDLDINCSYTIPDFTGPATASDNCGGIPTITQSPVAGTVVMNPGTTIVTLSATDDSGNTGTCSFNINHEDNTPPTLVCPMDTVLNAAPGQMMVTVDNLTPSVTDSCGLDRVIYTLSGATTGSGLNDASGNDFNLGTTMLTYTATDVNGNTSTCTTNITVNGAVAIDCPNDTIVTMEIGFCAETVNNLSLTITRGNANVQSITYELTGATTGTGNDDASGTRFNLGVTTVTYTVTDIDGNTIVCSFTVTVNDEEDPTFDCPADQILDATTDCTVLIRTGLEPLNINDNCGIDSVYYELTGATVGNGSVNANGTVFNAGVTTVTYFVRDRGGNIATCSFTITINDPTPPTITCPSDVVTGTDTDLCNATINSGLSPTVMDNCAIDSTWFSLSGATTGNGTDSADSTTFEPGITTITYFTRDANGNTVDCSFTVTVNDLQNPSLTCPRDTSITLMTGQTSIVVGNISPTASDNCSVDVTYTLSGATTGSGNDDASGETFEEGTTTVTYTASDANGNSVDCSFTVTIISSVQPLSLTCPVDQTQNTDAGNCSAVVTGIEVSANQPNPTVTYTLSGATLGSGNDDASGTTFNTGITIVTYTVTDGNGQMESCSFSVTIVDNENPVMACPGPVNISNCDPSITVSSGATDNCGIQTITYTLSGATTSSGTGDLNTSDLNPGLTTVVFVAEDVNGNTNQCTVPVTVTQPAAPTIACPAGGTFDTEFARCFATVNNLEATAMGGCDPLTLSYTITGSTTLTGNGDVSGTQFNTGTSTVTYTATDANGLTASCSFDIVVVDNENPFIGCPNDTIVQADPGMMSIVVGNIAPVAGTISDNCGVTTWTYSLTGATTGSGDFDASGETFNAGVTTVTYSVLDFNGNTFSCSFEVTVIPGDPLDLIECPADIFIAADADCNAIAGGIEPTYLVPLSSIASLTYELSGATTGAGTGDASNVNFNIGVTVVTYEASSTSGFTDRCSFTVTVEDRIRPTWTNCPSDLTVSNDPGICGASVNWVVPTASDNCMLDRTESSHQPGDIFPVGTTTVTYTAFDESGNEAICFFTITVTDDEGPVLDCASVNVTMTQISDCRVVVNWDPVVATDNCGIQSITSTSSPGDTLRIGITVPVIYIATDVNGNMSECRFEIEVEDNEPPTVDRCLPDITLNADPATCSAIYEFEGPSFSDCGPFTVDCNPPSGSSFPLGVTTVRCVATDRAGNTAVCEFDVTVVDVTAPTVLCPQDITLMIDGTVVSDPSNVIASATPINNCMDLDVTFEDLNVTDACDTALQVITPNGMYSEGTISISYLIRDDAGNESECPFNLTILGMDEITVSASDLTPCEGETVSLSLSTIPDNGDFSWTGPNGFTSTDAEPVIIGITPTGSGTYEVVYTNDAGCTSTDNVTIMVNPLPSATATAQTTVCDGMLMLDAVVPQGSVAITEFFWSGPCGFTSTEAENTLTGLDASCGGVYSLLVTTAAGCQSLSTVTVTIENLPSVDLIAECEDIICIDDGCTLLGTELATMPDQYNWMAIPATGAGLPTTTNTNELFVTPDQPGTYTYMYWVNIGDCTSDTASITLTVAGDPVAMDDVAVTEFEEPMEIDVLANDSVFNSLSPTITVLTRPTNGRLVLNSDQTFSYEPLEGFIGEDMFSYILCHGCETISCDTATVNITVEFRDSCEVPTVITPNQDGINDALLILCLETGEYPENELLIINEWGDQVFRAKPYLNNWEGTRNGQVGKDLPDGTYYYIFRQSPQAGFQKGAITIFR